MIKKFNEYINEDLRSKKIYVEIEYDNLKILYPNIKVNYNDDYKIVISYDKILSLNEEFYKILENDNIKIEDIIFENCGEISLYDINNFKKISDYGKFGEGIIDFNCFHCSNLQSLEGCPEKVGGYFSCSYCNNLQSLKGCPGTVIDFYCYGCDKLQSLEGSPEKVGGNFNCYGCNLDFIELAKQKYGDKVK